MAIRVEEKTDHKVEQGRKQTAEELPTVIVPYPGPTDDCDFQDVFVCLRPETNGMLVESSMLRVLKSTEEYSCAMELIYMANFPGEFIIQNNIVEQYCALKLHYAVMGRQAFTAPMKRAFSEYFHCNFEDCEVIGAFDALKVFNMQAEELFNTWVAREDICLINGQTIKRINNVYVVNYDIPAIIHKNNQGTDIAVMLFRTHLDSAKLAKLFRSMHNSLIESNIVNPQYDLSRAFHYSKSPFEQIMDSIIFLHTLGTDLGLQDFTFPRYLMRQGYDPALICGFLLNPTVGIALEDAGEDEELEEINLFQHTVGMDYTETCEILQKIKYQEIIVRHGPLLKSICPCLTGPSLRGNC